MKKYVLFFLIQTFFFCTSFIFCGCSQTTIENKYPNKDKEKDYYHGSILGEEGIELFSSSSEKNTQPSSYVNEILWQAAMRAISFAPLDKCDKNSGIISTEWYNLPKIPREKFKIIVHITSSQLRADGFYVKIYKKIRTPNNQWINTPTHKETAIQIEEQILKIARQIKNNAA